MPNIPDQEEQIRLSHAVLIHQVVHACQNETAKQQLKPMLEMATQQSWHALVAAINKIVTGQRGEDLLNGLDDEDKLLLKVFCLDYKIQQAYPRCNNKLIPLWQHRGLPV